MERWAAVDRHLEALLPDDPRLEATLTASAAAGLPPHDVSPVQGRLLELLARLAGARRILEIGTLAGYSTLWLTRGLAPDGHLVTLEADPRHAAVARESLARAGLTGAVELVEGPALATLPRLGGRSTSSSSTRTRSAAPTTWPPRSASAARAR